MNWRNIAGMAAGVGITTLLQMTLPAQSWPEAFARFILGFAGGGLIGYHGLALWLDAKAWWSFRPGGVAAAAPDPDTVPAQLSPARSSCWLCNGTGLDTSEYPPTAYCQRCDGTGMVNGGER